MARCIDTINNALKVFTKPFQRRSILRCVRRQKYHNFPQHSRDPIVHLSCYRISRTVSNERSSLAKPLPISLERYKRSLYFLQLCNTHIATQQSRIKKRDCILRNAKRELWKFFFPAFFHLFCLRHFFLLLLPNPLKILRSNSLHLRNFRLTKRMAPLFQLCITSLTLPLDFSSHCSRPCCEVIPFSRNSLELFHDWQNLFFPLTAVLHILLFYLLKRFSCSNNFFICRNRQRNRVLHLFWKTLNFFIKRIHDGKIFLPFSKPGRFRFLPFDEPFTFFLKKLRENHKLLSRLDELRRHVFSSRLALLNFSLDNIIPMRDNRSDRIKLFLNFIKRKIMNSGNLRIKRFKNFVPRYFTFSLRLLFFFDFVPFFISVSTRSLFITICPFSLPATFFLALSAGVFIATFRKRRCL